MSATRDTWPQPRTRLRERPRALAALGLVGLALVAASFGVGAAVRGGGSGRQDAEKMGQLKRALAQQSELVRTSQASAASLRTRNTRLSRRVTIQRTRATSWKRRYLRLRRSRARRR